MTTLPVAIEAELLRALGDQYTGQFILHVKNGKIRSATLTKTVEAVDSQEASVLASP